MSHFPVLVCLPSETDLRKLDDRLAEVMAPWSENEPVEPYRDYEEGAPEDFWWVKSIRRGAEHHRAGTIDERDRKTATFGRPDETDAAVRARYADDSRWVQRLGDAPTTWDAVVAAYNAKWGHGSELTTPGDENDSETMFYDEAEGRAYTMSTYNPESKWDYWRIGGRWKNYFTAKGDGPGLIYARQDWDSPTGVPEKPSCDGGPKALLDFDAMREHAANRAHGRYDQWEDACEDTPPARSWSHFYGLVEAGVMTIDEARPAYHGQPRIMKAREMKLSDGWGECVVEEFLPDRDEYVAEAQRGAVPGYALVTLGGQWLAPGRMGWFGMSSDESGDRHAYRVAANRYLDGLKDDRLIVVLDCHI